MALGEMMLLVFAGGIFVSFFFLGLFTFLDWMVQWIISVCLLYRKERKQVRIAKIPVPVEELPRE
ncbi:MULTISPECIES: hypothetical protein [Enterococcus]|uniref:Uncharacterized protein n=1 Tax=Enterococcus gallinarum TaxID=1353 RepID=A0A376H0H0_ENTGA|nr:hypothetical protein [Enterococcus gallinarum]EGO8423962.1 hypothetical protein [Enterococcus faecalis]STD72726.1 Uncharacterised protein [Enterococcus gallinarum]STD82644.1 Uncharacterised protein [Enterococcus gallinarum]